MEQQEVLSMLERVLKWYENRDRMTDNHYIEVKEKYRYILNGGNYQIVDKTDELKTAIAFIGGQIPTVNIMTNGTISNKPGITWGQAGERVAQLNI